MFVPREDKNYSCILWSSQEGFLWYNDLSFIGVAWTNCFEKKKLSLMSPHLGTLVSKQGIMLPSGWYGKEMRFTWTLTAILWIG